jgi:hypothetical protein
LIPCFFDFQLIRTTYWTRYSHEVRPDDEEGAERVHALHDEEQGTELEALNKNGKEKLEALNKNGNVEVEEEDLNQNGNVDEEKLDLQIKGIKMILLLQLLKSYLGRLGENFSGFNLPKQNKNKERQTQ